MGRSSTLPFARAVPVALLVALAAPAAAHADATLSVSGSAPHKTLTFTVGDALSHSTTASIVSGDLVIGDSVGITSGCAPVTAGSANCGTAAEFERVAFVFGAGDDTLDVPDDFPIDVGAEGWGGNDVLSGGDGHDFLRGWTGDDRLDGRSGDDELLGSGGDDYLSGGTGADVLDGDYGDDELWAADTPAEADTAIVCGSGMDILVADELDDLPVDCETTDPPYLDGDLRITGDPQEGNVLGLSLPTNTGGDGEATIQWERCDASGYDCTDIDGAEGTAYALTSADVGLRLRAWYWVENGLGDDWIESDATDIVRSSSVAPPTPQPPTTRPPRPTLRPPAPRVTVPNLVIPPLLVLRKPYFAMPNGDPIVDTGRGTFCPGTRGGTPCRLKVTARPSGASARLRGRPATAGESSVLVAAATLGRVRVPLNLRAYRLLRAHHKLTLSVTATITRPHSKSVGATFTITVKAPARRRR
jgi:hemolysin type calcium-binding protein